MGLYLYFIKRWLIKEAKINLDWYSLDFSLETWQYESTIFCILICFSVNFMPPQSHWPFSRFTRQIPEYRITTSPCFSSRMFQGSSRKEVKCHSGVAGLAQPPEVPLRRGWAATSLSLLSCICTSLSHQKSAGDTLRGPFPPRTMLPLAGMEANPNQTCFIHVSTESFSHYSCLSLLVLWAPFTFFIVLPV